LKSRLKYHLDGKSEQETQALYLKSRLKYRPDGDSEQETRELRLKSCLKYIQDAKLWVIFFPLQFIPSSLLSAAALVPSQKFLGSVFLGILIGFSSFFKSFFPPKV
jgi:hypothetical protein